MQLFHLFFRLLFVAETGQGPSLIIFSSLLSHYSPVTLLWGLGSKKGRVLFRRSAYNSLQVFIGGADGFDVKIFYQHIKYVGCNKGRQTWAQVDVLNPQV